MPTSWSASIACSSPVSVSLILTSRMRRGYPERPRRSVYPAVEAADSDWRAPGRRRLLGGRLDLAPGPVGARLDLLLGGLPGALLAPLRLHPNPLRLGLQLVLGAGPGDLLGLLLDFLDQLLHSFLGLAADLLGPFHDPLLDLGLDLDRGVVAPRRRPPLRRPAARLRRRACRLGLPSWTSSTRPPRDAAARPPAPRLGASSSAARDSAASRAARRRSRKRFASVRSRSACDVQLHLEGLLGPVPGLPRRPASFDSRPPAALAASICSRPCSPISRSVSIARSLSSARYRARRRRSSAAATRSSETCTHSSACSATPRMSLASPTAFNCLARFALWPRKNATPRH